MIKLFPLSKLLKGLELNTYYFDHWDANGIIINDNCLSEDGLEIQPRGIIWHRAAQPSFKEVDETPREETVGKQKWELKKGPLRMLMIKTKQNKTPQSNKHDIIHRAV